MDKYSWATEDLFENKTEWEKEYKKLEKEIDFSEFFGKLKNDDVLLKCFKLDDELTIRLQRLCEYAMMLSDKDTSNSEYDALSSMATTLEVKYSSATSFIVPEITKFNNAKLKGLIANPLFKDYDYVLSGILKQKKHILSEKEEKLLALSMESLSSFREIFSKIDNADLPLKDIKHKGEKIPMTHGTYGLVLHGTDRDLRRKFFKNYYATYIGLINTISSTYYGNVKKNVFITKVKNYNSCIDRALSNEDVPEKVYYNLIKYVNKALPSLHRYMSVKKKELGYSKMHMYDIYVPTVKDADLKLPYDEAYKLVIKGLSPLGKEYEKLLKTAYDNRWIDVYESKGKRSGAYSTCAYNCHPYVLLNYQQTTHDVFTIAHEMGHSIHSYFSNGNQPFSKANYRIFVAEVASTVNEVLLCKYLLKEAKDKKVKKYLLSYLLEMIRTTLFRQTQFAEFEEYAHKEVENGKPLTKDGMCEKYLELNKKYYGRSVFSDDEIKYEWARIPHFYSAFYVYKYATGIISALSIADTILTEGEPAVKNYFEFLASGDSNGPCELLKIAGVDLTTDKPYKQAFETFKNILKEYEAIKGD